MTALTKLGGRQFLILSDFSCVGCRFLFRGFLQTKNYGTKGFLPQVRNKHSIFHDSTLMPLFTSPVKRGSKLSLNLIYLLRSNATHSKPNNGIKTVSKKRDLRRLIQLAGDEKTNLSLALVLLIVSSTITMSVPFFLGRVIDTIYTKETVGAAKEKLDSICLFLFGVFMIGGLCNFGRVYLMNITGHNITQKLRKSVFSSIMKQDMKFFDKNKTGELINRLSADTAQVSQSITMNVSDGLRSTFMAVAGVSMMFWTSAKLASISLGIVPPVAIGAVIMGRYLRGISKNVQDSLADATQLAEERISNIRTVRAFSHEDYENKSYVAKINHVLKLCYKESLIRGVFFGMTGFSGNIIILTVLYSGGNMVTYDAISVGSLSSFLLYAAYVGVAINGISSFYSDLNKGLGASSRLFEIIDHKPEILEQGIVNLPKRSDGFVSFENVTFSYPNRPEIEILNNVSLEIPPGSVLAVVGPSGSGKSTIASLLLRLYDPSAGCIRIDGRDIREFSPTLLRHQIGIVPQEPVLFSNTIRENIAYGSPEPEKVLEEDILRVSAEANALEFINSFPKRFDTLVGERGVLLSGGQKQRVAIARALIKNPKVLIFDEATSALDAHSEHLVQQAIERVAQNRTVIIIAHRLSTIMSADLIAVLKEGKIPEFGSYQQLMEIKNGVFKQLIQRQAVS